MQHIASRKLSCGPASSRAARILSMSLFGDAGGQLLCDVCTSTPDDVPWAHHSIVDGSVLPEHTICRDCYNGFVYGTQGDPVLPYGDVGPQLRKDPHARRRVMTWAAKLRTGGSHLADFVPESIAVGERVELVWEDRYDIQIVSSLPGDAASLAGVQAMDVQDMVDIHGRRHKVILTDGGHKPVAVARRIQEFETKQHHLRPETMVCVEQASRVRENVKFPFALPKVAMTTAAFKQRFAISSALADIRDPRDAGCAAAAPSSLSSLLGTAKFDPKHIAAVAPAKRLLELAPSDRDSAASDNASHSGGNSSSGGCHVSQSSGPDSKRGRRSGAGAGNKGRGRGFSPATCNADRMSPGKPKKGEAMQLTVENILRGIVDAPKVVLSWRRQAARAAEERGTQTVSEIYNEQQELDALQAAISLLPEEMSALTDGELQYSLQKVLQRMSATDLPRPVAFALIRRSARVAMQAKVAAKIVEIAWPWGDAAGAGFDASAPRLSSIVAEGDDQDRLQRARDILVKECLAKLMMAKAERSKEICDLAKAISEADKPKPHQEVASKACKELVNVVLSIAALVQSSACTSAQLAALRWLSDEMESNYASVSVEGLKVFLEDAWWAAALRKIWATCSDEAVAAPQIEKNCRFWPHARTQTRHGV